MWLGKLWVETERNQISPFRAPHWSTTDGVTNAGLGLALEILTQRHCATNLLGVQRKSNHAMGKTADQVEGMQSIAWDGADENEGQEVKPTPAVESC